MKNFNEIYQRLNTRQKEAVDQIEGPVMVVAGPGTGKTQILSARIAAILQKTDTDASNILCLTYTEAGATAMRRRLQSMIGPMAFEVKIHTFHSLGSLVIKENESLFGMRGLQVVSDLEKEQLIRKIIDNIAPSNPLKKGIKSPYYNSYSLKKIFSLIKSENIPVDAFVQSIEKYIKEMPEKEQYQYKKKYKDKNAGDPRTAIIEADSEKLLKLKECFLLFETYEKALKEIGRYDFEDMLVWVLREFEKNEDLLLRYQEQFQYIMVDEFQDTNGTQLEILYKLCNYWDNPNVFVVGDDDQSIYKFQGANVGNIIAFDKKFSQYIHTTVLEQNYRSFQAVLDAADALIQHNTERLVNQKQGMEKKLIASNPSYKTAGEKPVILEFANPTLEAVYCGQKIKQLVEEGCNPSEIAVIYRNHAQSKEISRYLMSKNIPVYSVKSVNILQENIILQLITLLQYIQAERKEPYSGEHFLFQILHFECFDLRPIDIAKLSFEISRSKKKWRNYIEDEIHTKNSGDTLFEDRSFLRSIKKVYNSLEHWIKESYNHTVAMLAEKIIAQSGLLAQSLSSKEKNWNLQVLKTFFDFIKEESDKNPLLSIADLLSTYNLMQELEIGIEVSRVYGTAKGVQLVTAHSSKGLEYEHVFLIGCTSSIWSTRDSSLPFGMGLLYSSTNENISSEQESRRLFYVAMTRAKVSLQISWYNEANGKSQNAGKYVVELEESGKCNIETPEIDEEMAADFLVAQFVEPENNFAAENELHWLNKFTENYSLSVTHLNQYLKCKLSFYYDKVLRVPTAKSHFMGFGSAIHQTLEEWFKAAKASPDRSFWPLEILKDQFDKQMYFQRASFSESQYAQMLDYGRDLIEKYYTRRIEYFKSIPDFLTEVSFNAVHKEIPINGKVDKIELWQKKANLVDYKTGNASNGKKKLKRPEEEELGAELSFDDKFGGDYWRQIVFYHILSKYQRGLGWEMETGEVDFLEDEEQKNTHFRLSVEQQDVEIVSKQIEESYQGIQSHDFFEGCREKDCHWCNFHYSKVVKE